jgi:hypothetical protein
LLESSFVFEGKKAGDGCSASPALSKVHSYLDILMKKHFGKRRSHGNVNLTLTIPGMKGKDEEAAYEGVRKELNDDKHKEFYEEKLKGIKQGKDSFGEVYCSGEEGLVCVLQPPECMDCWGGWQVKGSCRSCGDEEVKGNAELREACHPEEEKEGQNGKGAKKKGGGGGVSACAQMSSHFIAAVGLLVTTLFGNFRW